ncbi:N-formylglutamate amidohydrolase [Planctomicrobium sp. SH661]|uniref:N-formylglutamate amidohydrolase n=1 Tax=Planctomicrobium sp. SH661 TaxID=3448124 RepID=UPI003F5B82EC
MRDQRTQLLVTCEHGGNQIPREFKSVFRDARAALNSHRGHDPGSLQLAKRIARRLHAPLEYETRSRLLIELNRTLGHPRIFSEFSRQLTPDVQQQLIEEIYRPYRERVITQLTQMTKQGPTLHLSVHSFTPVMNEKTRRTDIGLLFDPSREFELRLATSWKKRLKQLLPQQAIHFNLPYRGTSDGFTTALRKEFPDRTYAGIELEVNQKFVAAIGALWENLQGQIVGSLTELISD